MLQIQIYTILFSLLIFWVHGRAVQEVSNGSGLNVDLKDNALPVIQNALTAHQEKNLNDFNERPPFIIHRFRASIIDPRTVNQPLSGDNFGVQAPVIRYPFQTSLVDQRTNYQPILDAQPPIIRYRYRPSLIDPRTVDQPSSGSFVDENPPVIQRTGDQTAFSDSVPTITYRFKSSIVDPRTL